MEQINLVLHISDPPISSSALKEYPMIMSKKLGTEIQ